MKRLNDKKLRIFTLVILSLVLFMSIGYAAFSSKLNINGTGNVKGARWSIHYVNNSLAVLSDTTDDLTNITGDNVTQAATINTDLNTISFGIIMNAKTKYEFTVDITNDGSFDGVVKSILLTTTKGTNAAVSTSGNTYTEGGVTYTVTYTDGTPVKINDALKIGETRSLKFRAQYIPTTESVTEDTNYNFSTSIEYTQSSGLVNGEEVDVPYEITYVPNGGTITTTSKYVNKGSALGTLPTPTKAGATFIAWYSDAAFTNEVDANYIPTSNMSLYAKYDDDYAITIAAENYKYTSADKIYIKKGNGIGTFPTVTFKNGFVLGGWYTEEAHTNQIDTTYVPTSNMTIYAKATLNETMGTYYSFNGYKFKATGTANLLLLNNDIGSGIWSDADTKAKAFMTAYSSRLMTNTELNIMRQSEKNYTSNWWLGPLYGGSDGYYYSVNSGTVLTVSKANQFYIRPVISLEGVSFTVNSGSGTSDDPYIIILK